MQVILVRHTAPDVPPGTCYGQTDVPLRATFPQEAAATLARLRELLAQGPAPEVVFTSPLSRCTRLADYCGYPDAVRDRRLMEIDFGRWEMQPFEQIADPRLVEWYADYLHVEATGGESFDMQLRRVSEFLDHLRRQPYRRALIFAHGGVLICAQIFAGCLTADQAFSALTPYGGIIEIAI